MVGELATESPEDRVDGVTFNLRDRLSPGQRVWHVVGWNESRTQAWLQLDDFDWKPKHAIFDLLRREGRQPAVTADPALFERWQAWCVLHPASESGPIYPWRKQRRRRQVSKGGAP